MAKGFRLILADEDGNVRMTWNTANEDDHDAFALLMDEFDLEVGREVDAILSAGLDKR